MAIKLKEVELQSLFFSLESFTMQIQESKEFKYVLLAVRKEDWSSIKEGSVKLGIAANMPQDMLEAFLGVCVETVKHGEVEGFLPAHQDKPMRLN